MNRRGVKSFFDRFSMKKFNIAILEFQNLTAHSNSPDLSAALPEVIANDLDLSGYFTPMDKESFLEEGDSMSREKVRMRNYSVIGADFFVTGRYSVIGRVLEVEARLYDVFSGRQINKPIKRVGKTESYRRLMHSIGNEIIYELIG